MYIDKLDDTVNEYNNTYHRTMKMEPVNVKDNTYVNVDKEVNDKNPKFKIGDHVRIARFWPKFGLQKPFHGFYLHYMF